MTAFAIKLQAAKQAGSWQLALDKFPFNLDKAHAPSLSTPDERGREQGVKPRRLREIRDRYAAAQPSLKAAADRQQKFLATLAHQHGTRFRRVTLVNSSRLLLHLGRSSVLENVGLHCDRTTGLPVIPGTAVKGVLSTWACWEGNQKMDPFSPARSSFSPEVARILGSNPANDPAASDAAGCITFLGGFPQSAPTLELDIVTPHPLEGRGRITPNPFLAIKTDTKWDFALLASTRLTSEEITSLLDRTQTWLTDCLTQLGLGAKTAAGYGNFRTLTQSESDSDQKRFDELVKNITGAVALAEMSDEDRAYHEFVKAVIDWAPLARDVGGKPEPDKSHILRFFRSDEGKAVINNWPKNDKAKARKQALKDAGL